MKSKTLLLALLAGVQTLLSVRIFWRLLRSAGGARILPDIAELRGQPWDGPCVSVTVPVLNEYHRLAPCLQGLIAQGAEVCEIVVVDGGSHDGTQQLVTTYARLDSRVRLLDASPVPSTWNGKAWGLQSGLCAASPDAEWFLTVDADVRPRASLTRALLAQAERARLSALSIATLQEIEGVGVGWLHPSLLTTLVYRFGIPGKVFRRVSEVQANGQCFLFNREVLESCGGFLGTRTSICEDVTIARTLVAAGYPVGFYEAGDLVTVKMYADWRDAWRNWTRSLPMHDRFSGINTLLGWLEVALVQALPLPLLLLLITARRQRSWPIMLNSILLAMRIGVLFGTTRAYQQRPWSYWLSPLCDLPVAIQLGRSMLKRRHVWRDRVLVRGGLQ